MNEKPERTRHAAKSSLEITAVKYIAGLPPGTALFRKATAGPLLILCAEQWKAHRIDSTFVFNESNGRVEPIARYVRARETAAEFLNQWEIDLPGEYLEPLRALIHGERN
jgi:hypothetical protein